MINYEFIITLKQFIIFHLFNNIVDKDLIYRFYIIMQMMSTQKIVL